MGAYSLPKKSSNCNFCGESFSYYSTENNSGKFCSQDCYHKSSRKRVVKKCKVCEENFKICPSQNRTTCSKECQYELFREKDKRSCNECGEIFEVKPSSSQSFCSKRCAGCQGHDDVKLTCEECNKDFVVSYPERDQIYCSRECKYESQRNKLERECSFCGESYITTPSDNLYYCSLECMGKDRRGSNHMNWKGGVSLSYANNWWSKRKKVLERDSHSCVVCGRNKEEIDGFLDVHHIKPLRRFDDFGKANDVRNLVTLCRSHHLKVEGWNLIPSNANVDLS